MFCLRALCEMGPRVWSFSFGASSPLHTLKETRCCRCCGWFSHCNLRPCTRAGQLYLPQGLTHRIPCRLMLGDEGKAGWVPPGGDGTEGGSRFVFIANGFCAECRFQSNDFRASNPVEIFHIGFCQWMFVFGNENGGVKETEDNGGKSTYHERPE